MAYKFNPLSSIGLDDVGQPVSALNVLGTVTEAAELPGSGNATGDVYQAEDTGVFYVWDGSAWDNLGTLVGPQGPTGDTGPTGPAGADGVGIPVGGTDGQALVKASNTDYDTEWADVTAVAALDDLTDVTLTSPSDGQVLEYDSATSTWVNATPSGGGGTPGGSNTQVQFNDSNSFGGDDGLTFNKTTNELTVGASTGDGGSAKIYGDINLDDGGTYNTTVQMVTPTANRTISFPDATGTVALVAGSSGQLVYNNAGAQAGATGSVVDSSGNVTIGGLTTLAGSPSANNTSGVLINGTWRTGASSNNPQLLLNPSGTTLSTTWSTSGTGIGVNAASGFGGSLLDLQVNGTSKFTIGSRGQILYQSRYGSTGTNTGAFFDAHQQGGIVVGWGNGGGRFLFGGSDISTYVELAGTTIGFGGSPIGYSSTQSYTTTTADVLIARDAADTLAQRRGTNAQTFRCYGTYTDASNYVRASLSSTSTAVTLAAETAGTGADDVPLNLTAAGTGTVKVNSVAEVVVSSTVAGLPASPVVGMLTRVTDATAPAVGSPVSGGGAAAALVWYNGAQWTVIGV